METLDNLISPLFICLAYLLTWDEREGIHQVSFVPILGDLRVTWIVHIHKNQVTWSR